MHILVVSTQCDAVGWFTVCIYQFLKRSNKFSNLSSCLRNNADSSRYLSSRCGRACMHGLLQTIFMHILIVSSKCDAVGSFPACMYPFS